VAFGKTGNDYRAFFHIFVGREKSWVTGPLMVTCLVKVLNPMEWTWIKYLPEGTGGKFIIAPVSVITPSLRSGI